MNEMAQEHRDIFAKNLRALLTDRGKDQGYIVERLGVTSSTVSDWASAKKYPRVDKMQAIANLFCVPISRLRDEVADFDPSRYGLLPITTKRVPIIGTIAAGVPIFAEQEFESYALVGSEVQCDFALRVKGDSMTDANILDGYIVFIRQQPTVNDGEIAAVIIDDEATLKRVYQTKDHVTLVAANPQYAPIVITEVDAKSVSILGKAVAFQGDIK
jgi:repressor LexA